jgi:3-mercaptopyruvate sulfurtransferase SseA
VRQVLLEGFLVALIGATLAFAANALSPRGLKLGRDYYPPETRLPANKSPTNAAFATNALSTLEALAVRVRELGLTLADSNRVDQLFRDPRCQQGLVVFIDARNEEHYKGGHVPGAYLLDYFYKENYLESVLPACNMAQEIVVYCNGGNCEDSLLTANLLMTAIPKERLLVYSGGMTEWNTNGWPVEIGERNSGQFREKR